MPSSEELTATYLHEIRRFENPGESIVVGEVTAQVDGKAKRKQVIGPEEDGEPRVGSTYRFYGYWSAYKNRYTDQETPQFRFSTFVSCDPHSSLGVVSYLRQAPEIGKVLAQRLYDQFGDKAVEVLRRNPQTAAGKVQGLSLAAAQAASEWLESRKAIENAMIDVMEMLAGRGFPKAVAKQAIRMFGNQASRLIRQNPYLLQRFRGCGWKLCDALYLALGHPPAKLKRQAYCAWYAIASNTSGDTWFYRDVAAVALRGSIGGAEVREEEAIRLAARGDLLSIRYTDGPQGPLDPLTGTCCWLADVRKARSEQRVAKYVKEALAG